VGLDGIREKDEFHWLNIRTRECIDVVEIYYKRSTLRAQRSYFNEEDSRRSRNIL